VNNIKGNREGSIEHFLRDSGLLAGATTIQRLNTRGGVAQGPCAAQGEMLSVAYSADYAFHRRPRWSLIPDTTRHD